MGGKTIFIKSYNKTIRVSKKSLKKALHATHPIGKALGELL